jgi:uncharacterized protein
VIAVDTNLLVYSHRVDMEWHDKAAALAERPGYWELAHRMIEAASIRGGQVHDARVAALCVFHGVTELWSADRDFQRFPGLKTRNPLIA